MSEEIAIPLPKGDNWVKILAKDLVFQQYIRAKVGTKMDEDQIYLDLRDLPGWKKANYDRVLALLAELVKRGILASWNESKRWRYYAAAEPSAAEQYEAEQTKNLLNRLRQVAAPYSDTTLRHAFLELAQERKIVL